MCPAAAWDICGPASLLHPLSMCFFVVRSMFLEPRPFSELGLRKFVHVNSKFRPQS